MQVLEKYFDTAFNAPDGIKKLRELILTLAMQGKLVPQDPNDQTVYELIKEIEKEKEKLVKEGKIKKSKSLGNVQKNDIPFVIPNHWEWVYLNEIVSLLGDGLHGTPQYDDHGDYFFINGNNLNDGRIQIKENTKRVSITEYEKYKKNLDDRTVLVSINGTLGNVAFFNNENVVLGKSACYFNLFSAIEKSYIKVLINSKYFLEYANTEATGSTIKNVSLKSMREFKIPLPPLNEQKRIVEKINQLMALCDELEKLKEQKEAKKLTVHKSAINQLLDSKDESNSQKGWHFISNHFNDIYTVKENVSELRSAILQLAMQGKLVPQDSNDQSVSELLKKLNKTKNIPVVNSNEMSFSLPQNWEWERIVNLGITQTGTTPPKKDPDNYGDFIPFIGPGNIKNGVIDYSGEGLSKKGIEKGRLIEKDSILMVCIGGSIGKHAMTNQDISCNQQINTITVYPELSTQYVYWAMASQYFQNTVINQAGGSATPIINKLKWSSIPIPVPPYNEQQRIVEKINQLMALCDDLEKQIENSSSKQTQLLNAIMSNLGK